MLHAVGMRVAGAFGWNSSIKSCWRYQEIAHNRLENHAIKHGELELLVLWRVAVRWWDFVRVLGTLG